MKTKTTIPAHPHEAFPQVMIDTAKRYLVRVDVVLSVPSRIAALLPEDSARTHFIQCAGIGNEQQLACRARGWKRNLAGYLVAAIEEGCDTPIKLQITAEEWHLVGRLCGKLNITPGQWYLSCAAYNAALEEHYIEAKLATITDNIADLSA